MKTLERLRKKELINLITEIRPKANAYDKVCKQLGIENNILGYVEKLKKSSEEFKAAVEQAYSDGYFEKSDKTPEEYYASL
jgi:hypothetical protein